MDILIYALASILFAMGLLLAARRLTHYFQLESYQFQGYFKTVCRQWKRTILPFFAAGALPCGFGFLVYERHDAALLSPDGAALWALNRCVWVLLLALALCFALHRAAVKKTEKKKFALTPRMKRLYGMLAVVLLGVQAAFFWGLGYPLGAYGGVIALLPLLVPLAALLALPVERLIFRLYFRDAERKLMENDRLIRIGITGSYGKTSTKFILAEILSQKYNVLATPASFNTPMGVTRIIRERLTPSHQVFIGEMGARHVGEIKELCRLVHPQIGILTAVGPQHLDTFKTLERIEKTKYELIDALPPDGVGVFGADGAIVSRLYAQTEKPKLLAGPKEADAWAENVRVSPQGSHFSLCLRGWEPIPCETRLLGEHNIQNILVACAAAKHLGLSREQIARGVGALKPVEHRLQLLPSRGGVTVIDDAFNTNPRSSREALKVLSSFPGRRVVVTPGMVELGAEEERFNYEFGQAMAKSVDVAVLVGKKHTAPIVRGLRESGFPEAGIHVVPSLEEAVALNRTLLRPGDVVMYENDLPDHYSEG